METGSEMCTVPRVKIGGGCALEALIGCIGAVLERRRYITKSSRGSTPQRGPDAQELRELANQGQAPFPDFG